jgi:hypothetical protein
MTASSVLAQLQTQDDANLALVKSVFADAQSQGPNANLPAGFEAQFLGGQQLFQQDINTFIHSLPSSLSPTNDGNTGLINALTSLLQLEVDLSNTLNQIKTYQDLEQPIQLTALNVVVVFDDALILTEVSAIGFTYSGFAYSALTGQLVTESTPGAYTVNVPSGAKFVDMVLIGGGGGGGGYDTTGSGGNGGNTTATPAGGSTLTAAGGAGGASTEGSAATAGGSPSPHIMYFDGQNYTGGNGNGYGNNAAGGNGTAPGGGGGGGGSYGSYGGAGGGAGSWATETLAVTTGMTTITGTVGAGGTAGPAVNSAIGGTGAHGEAFFYFYS